MIYFTDGSKEAFLTAFLLAYHDENAYITSSQKQLVLGQESVFVQADLSRAERAERRLLELDKHCIEDLELLLRSADKRREQIAFRYLKFLTENKCPVRKMLGETAVLDAVECMRKITFEVHRMLGFVRFLESASGVLYAPISPDNDVVDMLVPHFRSRLPAFVLHDVPRKKAAVYDGTNTFLAPLEKAEVVLSAIEEEWQTLWKRYFKSVNIPSRERLKQQRGYLPVRYRKFMPEFHGAADENDVTSE